MDQEMDLNERYDKDVQKMAEHFDFDLDIVQECYEHCCVPATIDDVTYKVAQNDLKHIISHQKSLDRALRTYDQLSDIVKAIDSLSGINTPQEISQLLSRAKQIENILKREISRNSRAKGAIINAQIIAKWLALVFIKSGRRIGLGVHGSTGKPSTIYGKALTKAFDLFDVKGQDKHNRPDWRGYGDEAKKWAEAQLNHKK